MQAVPEAPPPPCECSCPPPPPVEGGEGTPPPSNPQACIGVAYDGFLSGCTIWEGENDDVYTVEDVRGDVIRGSFQLNTAQLSGNAYILPAPIALRNTTVRLHACRCSESYWVG